MIITYLILGGIVILGLVMYKRSRSTGGGPIRRGAGFRWMTGAIVLGLGLWLGSSIPAENYNSPLNYLAGFMVIGGGGWMLLRLIFDSGEVVESYKDDARYDANQTAWDNRQQTGRGSVSVQQVTYRGGGYIEQPKQNILDQMPRGMSDRIWNIVDDCKNGTISQEQAMQEMRSVVGRNAFDKTENELYELVTK